MSATQTVTSVASTIKDSILLNRPAPSNRNKAPLKSSGSLDKYPHHDSTVVIGTEFPTGSVQLVDLLTAPNSDTLIQDLAILVSQRGVVFFRDQEITLDQQKELGTRLGQLSGKPETSGLHTHPLTFEQSELGDQISVISSIRKKEMYYPHDALKDEPRIASGGWHADITFEKVPSDYAILKVHTLPETGGDTLWASAYEAYDRLSPAYATFLESLTAVHNATRFNEVADLVGRQLRVERGAPENSGSNLTAVHPVIRTNPVTGWKGLFVNKGFTKRIIELTKDESDEVLQYLFTHVAENHDLQVRFKWAVHERPSVAIWDNRSVLHSATDDYMQDIEGETERIGDRVVSLGEKPYYDPNSKSRRKALGLPVYAARAAY